VIGANSEAADSLLDCNGFALLLNCDGFELLLNGNGFELLQHPADLSLRIQASKWPSRLPAVGLASLLYS